MIPIFDAKSLNAAVADTMRDADVGADKNAFVAVVTRDSEGNVGVTGAIAVRVNDVWTVTGAFSIDHERRISGGAEIKATW